MKPIFLLSILALFFFLGEAARAQHVKSNASDYARDLKIFKPHHFLHQIKGGFGAGNGTNNAVHWLYMKAAEHALQAVQLTPTESTEIHSDKEVAEFYSEETRDFLIHELQTILDAKLKDKIRVRNHVTAWVDGKFVEVIAMTDLRPGSPIFVNRSLESQDFPMELRTHIILHEVAHHTGYQDEDKFEVKTEPFRRLLDRLADAILESAKKNSDFKSALSKQVTINVR